MSFFIGVRFVCFVHSDRSWFLPPSLLKKAIPSHNIERSSTSGARKNLRKPDKTSLFLVDSVPVVALVRFHFVPWEKNSLLRFVLSPEVQRITIIISTSYFIHMLRY